MADIRMGATSTSLVARPRGRPPDQVAWDGSVDRSSKNIDGWCHRRRLREANAQNVAPDVRLSLAPQLGDFEALNPI